MVVSAVDVGIPCNGKFAETRSKRRARRARENSALLSILCCSGGLVKARVGCLTVATSVHDEGSAATAVKDDEEMARSYLGASGFLGGAFSCFDGVPSFIVAEVAYSSNHFGSNVSARRFLSCGRIVAIKFGFCCVARRGFQTLEALCAMGRPRVRKNLHQHK